MKGGASKGSIGLLYDHDVDGPGESCCIDFIVKVTKIADEFANVIHAVHLELDVLYPCESLVPKDRRSTSRDTAFGRPQLRVRWTIV
jgi:hypothetical protein